MTMSQGYRNDRPTDELTLFFSFRLVSITILPQHVCQTIRQKSPIVDVIGPKTQIIRCLFLFFTFFAFNFGGIR